MGSRTNIAGHVATWGIAQVCLCETKDQGPGGAIAPFWGIANLPEKVSRDMEYRNESIAMSRDLSGTKIASQDRNDHGGRKRARNHSAAEIVRFFAPPAAQNLLAASDFCAWPQNRRKLAATTAKVTQVATAARFRGRSDHGTLSTRYGATKTLAIEKS